MANIDKSEIEYRPYKGEEEIQTIFKIIDDELSEPYGIFTYRYFMDVCPQHTFVATYKGEIIGVIVGRETQKEGYMKGYIAMLVVLKEYRKCGIGRKLAVMLIEEMKKTCALVSLDAEWDNKPALSLYESLGFVRTKKLYRYYLNGNQAYRLKIWF